MQNLVDGGPRNISTEGRVSIENRKRKNTGPTWNLYLAGRRFCRAKVSPRNKQVPSLPKSGRDTVRYGSPEGYVNEGQGTLYAV